MVGIDDVYQKVLAIANKEQRGYITPQEFNLFADHAQMDIFEQYFYDLEQRQRSIGNELDYADITSNIEEKISIFEIHNHSVNSGSDGIININSIRGFYRLNNVRIQYQNQVNAKKADEVQLNEISRYENSLLATPNKLSPVYTRFSGEDSSEKIKLYPFPNAADIVTIDYIRRPRKPNWTYIISSASNALYNPDGADHQNFELHQSEENNLVIKILKLSGIAIKDLNLTQIATQQEVQTVQQQKQ